MIQWPQRLLGILAAAAIWSAPLLFCPLAPAQQDSPPADELPDDLSYLSLETLVDIEITSVSKKPEALTGAAAAIFVITEEDIRRSGATSIPELLRMVPGIHVARIDANKWAVSARGWNDRFANKLLVLVDGRSVYNQSFSGVYWEVQDTLLEDIERIEVIRGPGASLWGANAVNGVINIITKHTRDTQGGLFSAGGGTEERGFGAVRYGGQLGEELFYRTFVKYIARDDSEDPSAIEAHDAWDQFRAGFRADWTPEGRDSFTLIGEGYSGQLHTTYLTPTPIAPFVRMLEAEDDVGGAFLLGRWNRDLDDGSLLMAKAYYDFNFREHALLEETRQTFDVEIQHSLPLASWNDLTWGVGYRLIVDDISDSVIAQVDQNYRRDQLASLFVQDEIDLIEDYLKLTLGARLEHNSYTGFEAQPNARLAWTPDPRHTVWLAFSRAVRTPAHGEHGGTVPIAVLPGGSELNPLPSPLFLQAISPSSYGTEEVLAYDLGYRVAPSDWLTIDTALFFNRYDKVRGGDVFGELDFIDDPPPGYLFLPLFSANQLDAETYGFELSAEIEFAEWWTLKPAYTLYQMDVRGSSPSQEMFAEDNPAHQASLRSMFDLPHNIEFDLWMRYVDRLPNQSVSQYLTLDARLAWKPIEDFELALVGQNLLDSSHPEFNDPVFIRTNATEIERGAYMKLTWRF